jgi:hypothetical protein
MLSRDLRARRPSAARISATASNARSLVLSFELRALAHREMLFLHAE